MPEKEPPEEKSKEQLLRDRWKGQEERIQKIIESARKNEDWTVHLEGLLFVKDVKPISSYGEKYGRDLRGIRLSGVNLSKADLRNARLEGADLCGSIFNEAKLSGAILQAANLQSAKLKGATLFGANLARANFMDACLENAIFHDTYIGDAQLNGANLSGAQFAGTALIRTDLSRAKLIGANLRGIEFQNVILREASFRDADLQDAKLEKVEEFFAGQLGGANVCNTKLPEDIWRFEVLGHVEEASKNARKIFLTMLLGCIYSWLTIATTTDVRLLTNSASSPLPIIGSAIPIVGFLWAAPVLLLGVYIYFHLCMQRLWEGLAELPAIFPDGKPLDKRIYPWLLTGMARAYFSRLKKDRPPFFWLQQLISIALAWGVVPITILFFWATYLPKHHWPGTILHVILLSISILFGTLTYGAAATTLRGNQGRSTLRKIILTTAYATILFAAFLLSSFGAVNGIRTGSGQYEKLSKETLSSHQVLLMAQTYLPRILGFIKSEPFVDFYEVEVSMKPPTWTGTEIDLVKGARLKGMDLRLCSASRAFLVNADLRDADLRGANFKEADLRGAKLANADLRYADLMDADLSGANLEGARLSGALLLSADLRGANLERAKLEDANLCMANLSGANLMATILTDAFLMEANLTDAELSGSFIDNTDLTGANLQNAKLIACNLKGAKFSKEGPGGKRIFEANLKGADIRGAKIRGNDLKTILQKAVGLSKEQIESAIIDENTLLPEYLEPMKQKLLDRQRRNGTALPPPKCPEVIVMTAG